MKLTLPLIQRLTNLLKSRPEKGLSRWDKEALRRFLDFTKSAHEEVLIIAHTNADPDAVASAVILAHSISSLRAARPEVAFPEGPSKLSRKLLRELGLQISYMKRPRKDYRYIAVVDANNCNQLGSFCRLIPSAEALLVIDHHGAKGDLIEAASHVIVSEEPATTVLVYRLARELSVKLPTALLTLALSGILFDTRRFVHATPFTLKTAACIIEEGGDYALALKLLEEEADFSERVAKLKGALRCHVLRAGPFLIAISEIGSHEAAVARALISLGADVALVASERKGECRLSVRFSRTFHSKTGLSVGRDLMPLLSGELEGRGGGHETAGGFNGRCSSGEVLRTAVRCLSALLGERLKHLK